MILIGSRALALRAPAALRRVPFDFDFLCTEDEANSFVEKMKKEGRDVSLIDLPHDGRFDKVAYKIDDRPFEFEICRPGTTSDEIRLIALNDPDTIETSFGHVPGLNFLFSLKQTHRYLKNSPHFWKNLEDYHKLKALGSFVPEEWKPTFKKREKETYNYAHPKLNVKKSEFFQGDQVNYVYDHDSIHRAVALLDRPAYTYYMKDGEEVQCDKEKFFSLPEEYRVFGHIEEACVLAIERSLVPFPGKLTPKQAWTFALSKTLTSITSGWFREWGYENVFKILAQYPENYFERFEAGVKNGTVLPFNPDVPSNPYK